MNKYLVMVLQSIVKALMTALNYERVKQLVASANDSSLSGEEKRNRVIEEGQSIAKEVGAVLLNLAIETAVLSLRK